MLIISNKSLNPKAWENKGLFDLKMEEAVKKTSIWKNVF